MMWINGTIAFVNIIGNILLIPYFSFIGSAWVTLVTQAFLMIITWWFVRDTIHIRRSIIFAIAISLIAIISIIISRYSISIFTYTNMSLFSVIIQTLLGGTIFSLIFLGGWWQISKRIR
jgi:O-antigen/teichoic acid export membrane protein